MVDLLTGTQESMTTMTLFSGANALTIERALGVWEIVSAGAAKLLASGLYRLTWHLLAPASTCSTIASHRC